MCSRVKKHNVVIIPGSTIRFVGETGTITGIWGIDKGKWYNARSERLDNVWKDKGRGVLELDSFYEGGKEFVSNNNIIVPVVYNENNEFAIITRDSNPIVLPYHHRMPVLLDPKSIGDWVVNNRLDALSYNDIRIAA